MLKTKVVRAAHHDAGDVRADMTGVDLLRLPPFTTLLVRTVNTVYRVVTTSRPLVYVQGGTYLPAPTAAYVDGAGSGGNRLADAWIGVGLPMLIRAADQCVMTSPVVGIATEPRGGAVVH